MADTTIWQRLELELNRLVSFYGETRSGAQYAHLPDEAWSGINDQFTQVAEIIQKLKPTGMYGKAVIDGKDGAAVRWARNANIAGEILTGIQKQFSDEDQVTRFWHEVVVQTGEDGRDVVVMAASAAPSVFAGVVVLLVLIIIFKVVR